VVSEPQSQLLDGNESNNTQDKNRPVASFRRDFSERKRFSNAAIMKPLQATIDLWYSDKKAPAMAGAFFWRREL
jgi:hypothetical protein